MRRAGLKRRHRSVIAGGNAQDVDEGTDTPAILQLIETRYGLAPLASRDAASRDMIEALDLQP